MNHAIILSLTVLLLPFISGCIQAIFLNKRNLVRSLYSATTLVALVASATLLFSSQTDLNVLYNIGNWSHAVGISFYINNQVAVMLFVIAIGYAISAIGFIKSKHLPPSAMVFSSLVFGGLAGLCISADLFNSYVFMEISSIATYILVSFNNKKRASYKIAFDYLVIGSIAGIIMLLGILMIYTATGTLSMAVLQNILSSNPKLLAPQNQQLLRYGYITILTSFALKAGLYPMSTWMIRSYTVSAPAISAFMSSCVTKVYVFLMYKISLIYLGNDVNYILVQSIGGVFVAMSLVGIIVMGTSNLGERNIRKEIAISSTIQVCYFTIGIFTFNSLALTGTMMQMIAHSVAVACLFTMLDSSFYNVDQNYLPKFPGSVSEYFLSRTNTTKIGSAILLLSVAGYPLTIGFAGKWIYLDGILNGYGLYHFGILIIGGIVGMLYTWRIIERVVVFNLSGVSGTSTKQSPILRIIVLVGIFCSVMLGQVVLTEQLVRAGRKRQFYFKESTINGANQQI